MVPWEGAARSVWIGKIVVYTGMLPYTQTEGALAAVIGHEMAHAVARHGSQRLLRTSRSDGDLGAMG